VVHLPHDKSLPAEVIPYEEHEYGDTAGQFSFAFAPAVTDESSAPLLLERGQ
jgi:hypothetical protein